MLLDVTNRAITLQSQIITLLRYVCINSQRKKATFMATAVMERLTDLKLSTKQALRCMRVIYYCVL